MLKSFISSLLLLVFVMGGCKKKQETVSKEEALLFARNLEKDVDDMKINFIEKNVIMPVLLSKINATIEGKSVKGMEKGVKNGLANNNYERSIYDIIAGTGSFDRVHHYEKEGVQHLIYRIHGPGGFNYIDFELAKENKKTGIGDLFLYATGENFSKSMGELVGTVGEHEGSSIEPNIVAALDKMKKHMANADYKQAKEAFLRLPYNMRNNRLYEATYLQIVSKISEEEYYAELEKVATKYESKGGYELMLFDVYLSRKDYDKALSAVDKIDSIVHKDPFLDYYRGLVNNMKGDKEKALSYFKKVEQTMPDFKDNYAELFAHYTVVNQPEDAKKYFDKYKKMKHADAAVISFYETEYPYLAK